MHYNDFLDFLGKNIVEVSANATALGADFNMILVSVPDDEIGKSILLPAEYVTDQRILLNIRASAISPISVGGGAIQFSTRFNKVMRDLYIPVDRILAHEIRIKDYQIHAMAYDWTELSQIKKGCVKDTASAPEPVATPVKSKVAPFLKVVK